MRSIWVGMIGVGLSACSSGPASHDSGRAADSGNAPTFVRSALEQVKSPLATDSALASAVDGSADLGFDLYRKLRTGPDSVFLSPFSITSAVAMAWAGTKGTTASEIATAFRFGDEAETRAAIGALDSALRVQSDSLTASFANAVWLSRLLTPLPGYLDTLALNYGAGVGMVDFDKSAGAASMINGWVSGETHGTIPSLLTSMDLTPETRIVLTNAVYLKARWASPFYVANTVPDQFRREDGSMLPAQMMRQTETLRYVAGDAFQAAALPYEGSTGHDFEIVVVLPKTSLAALEPSLSAAWLRSTLSSMTPTPVDLQMPRFTVRMHQSLKPALVALGVNAAFSDATADFSGLASPPGLHITDVVHEAYASVNEAGTEASAATAVIIGLDASVDLNPVTPEPLRLDHPFLVLIRHVETGAVLFLGSISSPNG